MWNMQPLVCTGVNTKLSCVLRRKRTGYLPWGKYSSSENTLNGPQGNVAGKTIDSVRLVQLGLNRLNEVTRQINYHDTNLLSCMTLDVEHFHSTTHIKVTSCPCCGIVVHLETARKRVWRDCQRGVHSTLVIPGAGIYYQKARSSFKKCP